MTSDTDTASDNDLHVAVRYSEIKEVKQALQCRLSPNKIGIYQWSPLHEASNYGYTDIVRLLLKYGGNPNLPDRLLSNTAVHYAAQEGHPTCLRLLIEAGGDYSILNIDGHSALDLATRACERVIEKRRVEHLIRMPLPAAVRDAQLEFSRKESATLPSTNNTTDTQAIEGGNGDGVAPDTNVIALGTSARPRRENTVKAWTPQICNSDPGTMGTLHMSFEYNSKKSYLKVRLWKLTGLMFSPTHSSKISTLYVKARFLPDVNHDTKRKSEEVRLSPLYGSESKHRKPAQAYVSESGTEVLFEPIKFKFTKPLVYEPISKEAIKDKVIYFQVMLKQKYTHRTYQIADMTLPLNLAVTRIVKEAFPLLVCTQSKLPDSMMVLPDIKTTMVTTSDPNLRLLHGEGTPLSLPKYNARPSSDINLREVLSVSSQSPSMSIDIPSEEEMAEANNELLSKITVQPDTAIPCDTVIPMPGVIDADSSAGEDNYQLETVKVDGPAETNSQNLSNTTLTYIQPADTLVRITHTDDDSDSSSSTSKHKSKLSKLLHSKRSTDKVMVMEAGGQAHSSTSTCEGSNSRVALTHLNESYAFTKHKLKPKVPQLIHSGQQLDCQNREGSDVRILIGDLELQDLDEPVKVHRQCKVSAEFIV